MNGQRDLADRNVVSSGIGSSSAELEVSVDTGAHLSIKGTLLQNSDCE